MLLISNHKLQRAYWLSYFIIIIRLDGFCPFLDFLCTRIWAQVHWCIIPFHISWYQILNFSAHLCCYLLPMAVILYRLYSVTLSMHKRRERYTVISALMSLYNIFSRRVSISYYFLIFRWICVSENIETDENVHNSLRVNWQPDNA